MSRYEITAINPAHKVVVGWDHQLLTFFAQVIDKAKEQDDEDDKFVLWVGCSLRELYEIEGLVRAVRKFADVPQDLRTKLYGDKDDGL